MRKGQEGNLGTSCRDRFHVRLDETNLGAGMAFEPREDFGHFFPSIRAGSDGDNLGFWVAKNEAQKLQASIPARSNDRNFGNFRHQEGFALELRAGQARKERNSHS